MHDGPRTWVAHSGNTIMASHIVRPRTDSGGILSEEQRFQAGSKEQHAGNGRRRGRACDAGRSCGAHEAPRRTFRLARLAVTLRTRAGPDGMAVTAASPL